MAKKRMLLCLGQSNGDPVGDENEWLGLHPSLFLIAASSNPAGSYNDNFTMPGTFPGFTTLNLMGLAVKESRYLVFYNPYATGYRRYPGSGLVAAGSTPTVLNTEQTWIAFSQPFTVTRLRTGEVRTVSATGANSLTVPAWTVAPTSPEEGEQFSYGFVALAGSTSSIVNLNVGWPNISGNAPKLTGVVLKCLTGAGANVGVERIISAVNGSTGAVTVSVAWPSTPNAGDTFEMKPQGTLTSSEWHLWGYWLPWCPYEGSSTAGKTNPYPPGFNYPGGIAQMRTYNPGSGAGISGQLAVWHHGAGPQIAAMNGSDVRVVTLAVGGASLSYNEFAFDNVTATGWFDAKQQCTFTPSSPNALWNRLMDMLSVAQLQATAEGHTLEIEAVVMLQGEADASALVLAEAYEANLRSFISLLRQEIVTRGFWSGDPDEIKWIHPLVTTTNWPYAAQVRAAITNIAASVPNVRTFETNGFPKGDVAHYSGVGQTQMENAVVGTLRQMRAEEEAGTAAAVVAQPSPQEIVASIDAAVLAGLDVVSFPGNGGQITLRGHDQMLEVRKYYAGLAAARTGPRKTLARLQ